MIALIFSGLFLGACKEVLGNILKTRRELQQLILLILYLFYRQIHLSFACQLRFAGVLISEIQLSLLLPGNHRDRSIFVIALPFGQLDLTGLLLLALRRISNFRKPQLAILRRNRAISLLYTPIIEFSLLILPFKIAILLEFAQGHRLHEIGKSLLELRHLRLLLLLCFVFLLFYYFLVWYYLGFYDLGF